MFTPGGEGPASMSADRAHVALLLEVSRRYWEWGEGQATIATAIGCSRPTVSRLLGEARRRGVVRVTVSHPQERLIQIEEALTRRFGIVVARVAASSASDPASAVETAVASCAASLLTESLSDRSVLAISNGRAVAATVFAMPQLHLTRTQVVQMIGSAGPAASMWDSPETCRNMAGRLGGQFRALPVPLVMRTAALARALRDEDQVATTLELAARADVALVGVGAVHDGHSGHIFAGHDSPRLTAAIKASGAVGHICGHHFDHRGRHVRTPICARTIAMDPARLSGVGLVLGVACGTEKVPALRAAMAGGFLSGLVCDHATATALLADGQPDLGGGVGP